MPAAPKNIDKHAQFGKVPTYLVKMEEANQRRAAEAEERVRQARIPAGCRYMEEVEKQSAVEELQASRRVVLDAIKKLPLSIETLGQRRRKIELDMKLTEIEQTLEKLSLKSVLIQI